MILLSIQMEVVMVVTVIIRIAKSKTDSLGGDFVSIVDW